MVLTGFSCNTTSKENENTQQIGVKTDDETDISNNTENEILDDWLKEYINEKEVISHLGNPEKKGKIEYWDAIGTYVQQWNYSEKGIILDMESESKNALKTVKSISITSPCTYLTSQKIGIGSDMEIVREKYADKIDTDFSDDSIIVVGTVYGGTIFEIENNKVVKIFIGAIAE